eukprot:363424-Chlamydomonas_euryale.AAC.11
MGDKGGKMGKSHPGLGGWTGSDLQTYTRTHARTPTVPALEFDALEREHPSGQFLPAPRAAAGALPAADPAPAVLCGVL